MTNPTPQPIQVTIEELYRIKGECVTQMEILQGKLQMTNQQIQNFLNQPR